MDANCCRDHLSRATLQLHKLTIDLEKRTVIKVLRRTI